MPTSKSVLIILGIVSVAVISISWSLGALDTASADHKNNTQSELKFHQNVNADDVARFQWEMNCRGCHGPSGEGNIKRDVPPLVELNAFQKITAGREFLVRVPGVSRSPLNNPDLTYLMNWMVRTMDPNFNEKEQILFTEREVEELRREPLLEQIEEIRSDLIKKIN